MQVRRSEPLQAYNSLALQATAAALVTVGTDEELVQACHWAREHALPVVPLGEGSNVVLAGDLEALVIRQASRGIQLLEDAGDRVILRVAAGENWHQLVAWTLQQGYFGLENLALIPGTVGAAPIQNIGAYGVELHTLVQAVHALEIADTTTRTFSNEDCEFGYRDSAFKRDWRDRLMITSVDFLLSRTPTLHTQYPALAAELHTRGAAQPTARDVFDAVVSIRRRKLPDPAVEPNAGSFFKNPVIATELAQELARDFSGLPLYPQADGSTKLAAAWLIDHCGWKGYRDGGLGIHPQHALVLVNYGGASGERLLQLAEAVADSVADTFGIRLELEPRVYGQTA